MNDIKRQSDESLKFVARHYKKGIFNPDTAWQKITGKKSYSLMQPAMLFRIASFVLILITVGIIYQNTDKTKIITAQHTTTSAILPDQSEITLQPGAKLSYKKTFNKEVRNVSMSGDISFKVAHNAQKPFIVHTQNAEIKVIGTTFDVSSYNETTELNVTSGVVRFAPDSVPVSFICTKNMLAKYNGKTKELSVNSPDWSCLISKKSNNIRFKNASLAVVCNVLNQYYDINIVLSKKDAELKLTTTLLNKNINEIIAIINLTLDTQLTY